MSGPTRAWLAALGACVALGILSLRAQAPARATGLRLATQDELRGVPLASTPYSGAELPRQADLTADMPPPLDQGQQNSCVAWAVGYALKSYQERIEEGRAATQADGSPDPSRVFSPAFIYNQINQGRDGGSSFVDALNLLRAEGVSSWADMPYDSRDFTRRPTATALAHATTYRIDTWRQVNVQDTIEIKAHLNGGYPVLIGATVDEGFMAAGPGFIWRGQMGKQEGGHAMVLVGYDDDRQAFKVQNSWGTAWGDGGYSWIGYEYLRRAVNEAYVAKDARNGPPPVNVTDNRPVPAPAPAPPAPTPPPPAPPPAPAPSPAPAPPIFTPPPTVVQPTRPPQFTITSIQPNATIPGNPAAGAFLRFDGALDIPAGAAYNDQVAITFWFNNGGAKGPPVQSLNAQFATPYGQAAMGTALYQVPREGVRTGWAAWIPYDAMYLNRGAYVQTAVGPQYQPVTSYLLAEPTLYLDGFGVVTGPLIPLQVVR